MGNQWVHASKKPVKLFNVGGYFGAEVSILELDLYI